MSPSILCRRPPRRVALHGPSRVPHDGALVGLSRLHAGSGRTAFIDWDRVALLTVIRSSCSGPTVKNPRACRQRGRKFAAAVGPPRPRRAASPTRLPDRCGASTHTSLRLTRAAILHSYIDIRGRQRSCGPPQGPEVPSFSTLGSPLDITLEEGSARRVGGFFVCARPSDHFRKIISSGTSPKHPKITASWYSPRSGSPERENATAPA